MPLERSSPTLVVLPYTAGVSEDIRRVCGKYGMKVIFKAGRSLCLVQTKVKDHLPMEKKAKVVYQIPCSCGKSYIGETRRRLHGDQAERTPRGLLERNLGEVCSSRACMKGPPCHQMG